MTRTENRFEELTIVEAGMCMSPDGVIKVSFNGRSENDNPYKSDIGHDTGQTCLNNLKVGAFVGRQRREQV